MYFQMKKQLFAIPLMAMSLGLGGCISVLPEPKQPEALVRLPTTGVRGAVVPLETNVIVYLPNVMGAMSGSEIASADDQRIRYINNVRWADSPAKLFQEAVVTSLAKSDGQGQAVPVQTGVRGDYDLRLSILDLTVNKETDDAVCEVRLVLTRSGDRDIIASTVLTAREALVSQNAVSRAEILARAIQSAASMSADFVAEKAIAYDVEAERAVRRQAKRDKLMQERKEENQPEEPDFSPEIPPEIELETDV